jgi:hypothetical protein
MKRTQGQPWQSQGNFPGHWTSPATSGCWARRVQALTAGRWALTAGRINLMKPQTGATMMGEIEEACGRIEHLVESGYLPDSLKRDLELLLRAVKRGSAGDADDGPASIMKRSALIELADLVGTTEQTIGKIEKSLEHSSFSAIADVLGIDRRLLDRPALNAMKP